ncbi:MAG: CapA family protein [Eubacteriales bacterium]|nr:CapA family protein [Eubacteriales bacterium]
MNKNGLRIGNYRITPLGLTVLFALVALILALIILLSTSFKSAPDAVKPTGNNVISVETPTAPINLATPTPTPVPTPTPMPTPRSATIRSLGEIAMEEPLLEAAYNADAGIYDFSEMFSMISDVMGNADYTIADVEGPLGDTKAYGFQTDNISTPSSLIAALKQCGVDMLTLANDHTLDSGWNGVQDTIAKCIANNMDYIGASTSNAEKSTPVIRDIQGIRVAFLNYTDSVGGKEGDVDKAAIEYGVNWISNSSCKSDVAAAKEAGADVIIAYVSWGKMFERTPSNAQYTIAKALADVGVDVVIGYNPHVIQPFIVLETEQDGQTHKTYVLGATGNFISNRRDQYTDSGIILQFEINEQADGSFAIENLGYIPTYVWRLDNGDGTYEYHTLAVGQWLESQPEGMSYADYTRLKQVWAEAQTILGTSTAACLHE